jgi:hypothetical protein
MTASAATPLGTCFDSHSKSWVVVIIGTGFIVEPRSIGEADPWSHWEAFNQLLKKQGRQSDGMSFVRRKNMASRVMTKRASISTEARELQFEVPEFPYPGGLSQAEHWREGADRLALIHR